jgi:hypothetical protein
MKVFIHTTAQFDIQVPGSRSLPNVKNWYNFLLQVGGCNSFGRRGGNLMWKVLSSVEA